MQVKLGPDKLITEHNGRQTLSTRARDTFYCQSALVQVKGRIVLNSVSRSEPSNSESESASDAEVEFDRERDNSELDLDSGSGSDEEEERASNSEAEDSDSDWYSDSGEQTRDDLLADDFQPPWINDPASRGDDLARPVSYKFTHQGHELEAVYVPLYWLTNRSDEADVDPQDAGNAMFLAQVREQRHRIYGATNINNVSLLYAMLLHGFYGTNNHCDIDIFDLGASSADEIRDSITSTHYDYDNAPRSAYERLARIVHGSSSKWRRVQSVLTNPACFNDKADEDGLTNIQQLRLASLLGIASACTLLVRHGDSSASPQVTVLGYALMGPNEGLPIHRATDGLRRCLRPILDHVSLTDDNSAINESDMSHVTLCAADGMISGVDKLLLEMLIAGQVNRGWIEVLDVQPPSALLFDVVDEHGIAPGRHALKAFQCAKRVANRASMLRSLRPEDAAHLHTAQSEDWLPAIIKAHQHLLT